MPKILNLLASLFLRSINRKNLPNRVGKGATLLLVKKLFQKVGAVSLICY
jgi:hypothetical protein